MATPTTTWAAIRTQMVATIKALTPTSLASDPFRLSETEQPDFRAHADANDSAVLREYDIEDTSHEVLGAEDSAVQLRRTECQVVVAYPEQWGAYATMDAANRWNDASMRALVEQDANQIMKAIGRRGAASYTSGQHAALESTWSIESGDGVSYLVIPLECIYYYDAS